jgi:hypothetical protein
MARTGTFPRVMLLLLLCTQKHAKGHHTLLVLLARHFLCFFALSVPVPDLARVLPASYFLQLQPTD